MAENYVKEITKDEIRELINRNIKQNTGYSTDFESIEQAINASVEAIYERANEFETLTQEMIDEQSFYYGDGYLYGASVGDLVFGDDEVWVSEDTISAWYGQETIDDHRKDLDVSDIENIVCYELVLNRLWLYNKAKTDHIPDTKKMVECPHCNKQYQDGTQEAEFIGWHGMCAECELKDGE